MSQEAPEMNPIEANTSEKGPENKGAAQREMMTLPDGTVADVTNMSPEERRELINDYKAN